MPATITTNSGPMRTANMENDMEILTSDQIFKLAERIAATKAFDTWSKKEGPIPADPGKMAIQIMAGQEIGFEPIESIRGISFIKGKLHVGATMLGTLLYRHGYKHELVKSDVAKCEIDLYHRGDMGFDDKGFVGKYVWTMAKAKETRIAEGFMWQNWPENMLYHRCLSDAVKFLAPHAGHGTIYTEFQGETEIPSDGQGIQAIPETVTPAQKERNVTPEPAQDEGDELQVRMQMMPTTEKHSLAFAYKSAHGMPENGPFPKWEMLTYDDKKWIELWFVQREDDVAEDIDKQFKQAVDK